MARKTKSGSEKGTEVVASLLAKIADPAQREAVKVALEADANTGVVTELGNGYLRQDELSRGMDAAQVKEQEAAAWHENLTAWQAEKQRELDTAASLRTRVAELEAASAETPTGTPEGTPGTPPVVPAAGLSEEQVAALVAKQIAEASKTIGSGVLNLQTFTNQVNHRHLGLFGELPDWDQVLKRPEIADGKGIEEAYQGHYKEAFVEKETERQAAHDKTIGEAAVAAHIKEHGRPAYPMPSSRPSGAGTVLESLSKLLPTADGTPPAAPDLSQFTVDAAAEDYIAAVAKREGGAA